MEAARSSMSTRAPAFPAPPSGNSADAGTSADGTGATSDVPAPGGRRCRRGPARGRSGHDPCGQPVRPGGCSRQAGLRARRYVRAVSAPAARAASEVRTAAAPSPCSPSAAGPEAGRVRRESRRGWRWSPERRRPAGSGGKGCRRGRPRRGLRSRLGARQASSGREHGGARCRLRRHRRSSLASKGCRRRLDTPPASEPIAPVSAGVGPESAGRAALRPRARPCARRRSCTAVRAGHRLSTGAVRP